MSDQPRPVTITELAERTGMHRNTIVRDIDTEVLPATKEGNLWVIDPADADAYAEARSLVLRGEKALAGLRDRAQERIAKRARR